MARFRLLSDANRFVQTRHGEGRWEIIMPDGRRLGEADTVVVDANQVRSRRRHDTVPDGRLPFVRHPRG